MHVKVHVVGNALDHVMKDVILRVLDFVLGHVMMAVMTPVKDALAVLVRA